MSRTSTTVCLFHCMSNSYCFRNIYNWFTITHAITSFQYKFFQSSKRLLRINASSHSLESFSKIDLPSNFTIPVHL